MLLARVLHTPSASTIVHATHAVARCGIVCRDGNTTRRGLFVVFLLTFVPYFVPYDQRPPLYRDGLTREESAQKAKYRALGMDLDKAPFVD